MWRQRLNWLFLPIACALINPGAQAAQGFTGGVTPSRFEVQSEPGELVRRSLKIYNLSARPQQYQIKTADWHYSESGQISFQNELTTDSCRPWVRLERHQIQVLPDPQRPRPFRFEMQVPADAAKRECRLAIMLESVDNTYAAKFAAGAVSMPIAGRIAVIVYLNIGAVTPQLQIGEVIMHDFPQGRLPAITVRNLGAAHGRLDSDLVAHTATGERIRLAVATSPVLPGQTRRLALSPDAGRSLTYPIKIKGRIYSDENSMGVDKDIRSPGKGLVAGK